LEDFLTLNSEPTYEPINIINKITVEYLLTQLTPKEKEIVEKLYFEQLGWKEIEDKLKISHQAIADRWNRAKKKMRKLL